MKEKNILILIIVLLVVVDFIGIKLFFERTTNIINLTDKISKIYSEERNYRAKENEKKQEEEKRKEEEQKREELSKTVINSELNRYEGSLLSSKDVSDAIDCVISLNEDNALKKGRFIAIKFENFNNYSKLTSIKGLLIHVDENQAIGIIGIPNCSYNDNIYIKEQTNLMNKLKKVLNSNNYYDISVINSEEYLYPSILLIKEKVIEYGSYDQLDEKKIDEYAGNSIPGSIVKLLIEDIVSSKDDIIFTYKNVLKSPKKNGTIEKKDTLEKRNKDLLAFKFYIDLNKKYKVEIKHSNNNEYIEEVIIEEL